MADREFLLGLVGACCISRILLSGPCRRAPALPGAQPHNFHLFTGFLGTICLSGCLGNQQSLPCSAVTHCSNTAETKACAHTSHPENPSHAVDGAQVLSGKPRLPFFLHLLLPISPWARCSGVRCVHFPASFPVMWLTHRAVVAAVI